MFFLETKEHTNKQRYQEKNIKLANNFVCVTSVIFHRFLFYFVYWYKYVFSIFNYDQLLYFFL